MKFPIYIHYGATALDFMKGFPIRNIPFHVKPQGGLWASREDSSFGWKQWCEREDFRECDPKNSFRFTLKDDAHVAIVSNYEDLKALPESVLSFGRLLTSPPTGMNYCIDFEKCLSLGIDAIELCWYGREFDEKAKDDLYFLLYGWDCDSIVILNQSCILPIE